MRATETQDGPLERTGQIHVIESRVQKWRFKCPNWPHHHDWRLWNGVFSCETCRKLRASGKRDVESVFSELWDGKVGQYVPRERIEVRL